MSVPIHVAIPSYNNRAGLQVLLPQLQAQSFASITVLDDASTDGTAEYVNQLVGVDVIRSEVNLGTVGANNLQLQSSYTDGYLLCIDSDMQLITNDVPARLQQFLEGHPNTGALVGRIENASGRRVRWNFNYDINPWRAAAAFVFYHLAIWSQQIPVVGDVVRRISTCFTCHLAADVTQKVDWGIEGFFVIRNDVWRQLGGFDTRFKRYHEGPDLFLTLRKMGYQTWYTPDIVARDTDQNSHTSWYRTYHWWRSTVLYLAKHPSRLLLYYWPRP